MKPFKPLPLILPLLVLAPWPTQAGQELFVLEQAQEQAQQQAKAAAAKILERKDFQNMPLEEFKRLSPARLFLLKHRRNHPPPEKAVCATAEEIVAGLHNAGVWVELAGEVTWHHPGQRRDGDYVFNIGKLHLEIPPEQQLPRRLFGPEKKRYMHWPKTGETVKIRGWTYYDVRDKEGDGWWEIHPVMYVEVIAPNR